MMKKTESKQQMFPLKNEVSTYTSQLISLLMSICGLS